MDITIQCRPNPLYFSSTSGGGMLLSNTQQHRNLLVFSNYAPKLSRPRRFVVRASSASPSPNGSEGFTWVRLSESVRRASQRLLVKLNESVKKETGFDIEDASVKVSGFVARAGDAANNELHIFRTQLLPQFINWNTWDRWKEIKNWDTRRIGALVLYLFVMFFSFQRMYMTVRAPLLDRQRKELSEAYFEALIPEPTPANVRKFKEGMWRKTTPKGLKLKKLIEGPDSTVIHDTTYVGENAWDDETPVKNIIDNDVREERSLVLEKGLGDSVENQEIGGTWRERLQKWKEILRKEKLMEELDSLRAKYVVEFDMKEVENSLRRDVAEKAKGSQGTRGLWISKRWWRYRPKLPYTYFLQKLDSSEVAAVVLTEDLKRLYVTMKEGFPLEYIVDIPLDPYLFEMISSSGADIDLLQRRQSHYFMKAAIVLGTGIVALWFIRESLMLLYLTTRRLRLRMYSRFIDKFTVPNFILPFGESGETKSMYKDVVLGGDVWDLLDELMIYMGNPMQFYEKDVKFVRGVLLYGPPGTGKTLFARTLSKRCGIPFVYASGAEFSDSSRSGAARINQLFSLARKNAPAFVFVDEIDAIAGRYARRDPRRRATFEALISQLDGERVYTGIDRCSLSQSVIFICATNRPDELDPDFMSPGRIDRRLYIGLPEEKQRVQIFGVHSRKKQLAEDVDFEKIVFRTVGYSGADIRNLVNEAAIMAVRKQHSKIHQQDIIDVLDKQLLEGMGALITEEERERSEKRISFEKKRLIAVHEAGHILLAHLFPRFDWHAFSQLLPGGKETAMSVFYPREDILDQGYSTFAYLKMQMVVAHGGRCAERVVFGDDVTDGGRDDLKKITKIGREMVISPSNSRLGLTALTKRMGVSVPPETPTGEVIKYKWDDSRVIPVDMSVEVSELFTRELNRYIEETEVVAMDGLRDNKHILDSIVKILLEKLRITGLEAEEVVKGSSPVMFEDYEKPLRMDVEGEQMVLRRDGMNYKPLDIYPAPLHRC